ncbi:MAG: class I SAM-dependent methyltransferase [Pseudomonadota bacterium]
MTEDMRSNGSNPWLDIPAEDYEGHMSAPDVGQAAFLSEQFAKALTTHDAAAVSLLGCATGNGLEKIDPNTTRRLLVVDINRAYLDILDSRFTQLADILEAVEANLETFLFEEEAFTLMFGGLIFEYVALEQTLKNIAAALQANGTFVAILQLPSENVSMISNTPFKSLTKVASIMRLVEPEAFVEAASAAGLVCADQTIETLASGKSFAVITLKKKAMSA